MEGKSYQQLIAEVLFWHSVIFDKQGFAVAVQQVPLTIDMVRSSDSRSRRLMFMRKDVALALRERELELRPERVDRVFSLARIGDIVGRHHSTILYYMRPDNKKRPAPKPRFEIPHAEKSHVEHMRL